MHRYQGETLVPGQIAGAVIGPDLEAHVRARRQRSPGIARGVRAAFLLTTPLLISNPVSLPELSCQSSLMSCGSAAVTSRFDGAAGTDIP